MTFTRTSFVALSMLTLCCLALLSPAAASMNFIMDSIFVGDQHAAGNIPYLQSNNVSAILNVAWDLDIQYPTPYYVGNMADNDEHLVLQYSKVGLVDGTGNQPGSLIAAMFALHQFLEPRVLESKDQGTFPQPVQNVLVHCHSGQSRSVTTAALYIFYQYPQQFSNYDEALNYVKAKRGLAGNSNVPESNLNTLAHEIASQFHKTIILW